MQAERHKAAAVRVRAGFIGLGDIGMPMVSNMLKAGIDVSVNDLRQEAVAKAVASGARAATVKSLATDCDFIGIALINEGQVRSVLLGPDGILENARPGAVILSHSTMPPHVAQELGRIAESKGVDFLDAPMSGANIAAKAGTLTFMIGGKAEVLERCRPILESMGSNIFHLGGFGAGQVAKLVNGLMFHVGYVVTLEALRLAKACSVPEESIIALARVSTGNCWMVENWGYMDRFLREHTMAGSDQLIQSHVRKDIADGLIAAKAVKTALPMSALAMELYPVLLHERMEQGQESN